MANPLRPRDMTAAQLAAAALAEGLSPTPGGNPELEAEIQRRVAQSKSRPLSTGDEEDNASVDVSAEDRELWRAARTVPELGDLMARWLEKAIDYQPCYYGGPDDETTLLVPCLAQVNRAGFVTHFSQPGEPWGPAYDGRACAQRAAVSGFCSKELRDAILQALLHTDLIVIDSPPGTDDIYATQVCVSYGLCDLENLTVCGAPFSAQNIDDDYGAALHREALLALHQAWQIAVIDPIWGRNDVLWPSLMTAIKGSMPV